jgi:hyaluronan synthase
VITRWADWLENSRALYAMPAQSVLGQVGCLPGRTIAFRREILVRVMPEFMTGRFLGVFLEVSDDRTLTNLTLKEGYRTGLPGHRACATPTRR